MYNARNYLPFLLCLLIFNCCLTPLTNAATSDELQELKELEKENKDLKELVEKLNQRIKRLEPIEPKNIQDPPWEELPFPSSVLSVSEVIKRGTKIPFKIIVNKPNYKRLAYEEHWHSTVARWSSIPIRTHYSLHRLFTNYDIGLSNWYDFEHNIGISIPMFQDKEALDLYIVTFKTQVTNVYTIGNQVVVVGTPSRYGLQVITITTRDIKPINKGDSLLVHLATQDGHEIDYSLTSYVQPDFWAKQIEKLKKRER